MGTRKYKLTKTNTGSQSTPVDNTRALASWALLLGHTSRSHTGAGKVALTLSRSSQKEGPQDHSAQGTVNWVSH